MNIRWFVSSSSLLKNSDFTTEDTKDTKKVKGKILL